MINVSPAITNNIDSRRLKKFLIKKNCIQTEEEQGMEEQIWISNLINNKKIDIQDLNNFLFDEIFYGMHRLINIYKIKSLRKVKFLRDWMNNLFNEYNIYKLDYNNIVERSGKGTDDEKILAVKVEYNENNELVNLRIIFEKSITLKGTNGNLTAYSYIPVEINFDEKLLIVKARYRHNISNEFDKPKALMKSIYEEIVSSMNIEIIPFMQKHREALYNMSKGLVEELFKKIPAFKDILQTDEKINDFIGEIIEVLSLDNINSELYQRDKNANTTIVDFRNELTKLIQQFILSDYFFNRDEDNIWHIGITAIITCIRFNDTKNATARLNGENRTKHIFNSKSFMGLRNSIDSVKVVESLDIAYRKNSETMHVKYDARDEECLSVLFKSYKPYESIDFYKMWEMYTEYESNFIKQPTGLSEENFS